MKILTARSSPNVDNSFNDRSPCTLHIIKNTFSSQFNWHILILFCFLFKILQLKGLLLIYEGLSIGLDISLFCAFPVYMSQCGLHGVLRKYIHLKELHNLVIKLAPSTQFPFRIALPLLIIRTLLDSIY